MARTNVPIHTYGGAYPSAGAVVTETAADTVNFNEALMGTRTLLRARNSGATGRTVTINSRADPTMGRVKDITADAIAAGVTKTYGPFPRRGWAQAGNKLNFEANHAEVLFSVEHLD